MNDWPRLLDFVKISTFQKDAQSEILEDGAIWLFGVYKNSGMIKKFKVPSDYTCSRFYDRLKELGLIAFEKDKRSEIALRAEKEYSFFIKGYDIKINSENKSFVCMLKRTALLEYFDTLIKEGKDIIELLTPVKPVK